MYRVTQSQDLNVQLQLEILDKMKEKEGIKLINIMYIYTMKKCIVISVKVFLFFILKKSKLLIKSTNLN